MANLDTGLPQKRKSRGRGLRATTGCLICKRRHVKCNEARPQCGPCAIGKRPCVYSRDTITQIDALESLPEAKEGQYNGEHKSDTSSLKVQDRRPIRQGSPRSRTKHSTVENVELVIPRLSYSSTPSLSTESSSESRIAPLRWLELLATDATNAGGGTASVPTDTSSSWTLEYPIPLSDLEHYIFRHFVYAVSKQLDFHDSEMHFTTTVPHMALHNVGLMKALLALSARHLSLARTPKDTLIENDGILSDLEQIINRNLAVEYYTESLHYLNQAMQYSSYTQSLDLITTAILISTYEMVDGWDKHWERHLKGLFWIQRFQGNDGESGGLRQAVWWAWLQQDTWVAMRERRRVYSTWSPKNPISSLTAPEIATRASYLLCQCVNFASDEEKQKDCVHRAARGTELLHLLQEWREALPPEYSPLPCASNDQVFPSIWVNPPSYAAALQIHSLALILIILNYPSSTSIGIYGEAQHMLDVSVRVICGIARSVAADDDGANMISLNCLFGAAMCVHDPHERLVLLDLVDSCQRRIHWPLASLRKELELDYSKQAFHDSIL